MQTFKCFLFPTEQNRQHNTRPVIKPAAAKEVKYLFGDGLVQRY